MTKPILLFGARAALGELTKSLPADKRPKLPAAALLKANVDADPVKKPGAEKAKEPDPAGPQLDQHHKQATADFARWAEHPDLPDHVKQASAERRDQLVAATTPDAKKKSMLAAHAELRGMADDEDVPGHAKKEMTDRHAAMRSALGMKK